MTSTVVYRYEIPRWREPAARIPVERPVAVSYRAGGPVAVLEEFARGRGMSGFSVDEGGGRVWLCPEGGSPLYYVEA